MGYQKIIIFLDNKSNQPSKFGTKIQIEINYDSLGVCKTGNQIRFKTSMLKSSLCDYSDAYILVIGTITTTGAGTYTDAKRIDERNNEVIFKSCGLFIKCTREIKDGQIDHGKDLDIWCLCIIQYNTAIITQNHPEVYDSTIERNRL